ncbi:hypothetical protein J1N35_026240 [Gossypium stocksii]|uniref:DUF4283 domain-containing protein n=1 Tax=Gossypium stocksii TaxID=47602 RepID=A0A9D3V7Z2_9ROSI|nr:hypothetical protein J1N35_026240 [Gossypium stocksii]
MVMEIELNNLSLEEKEDSELQVASEVGLGVSVNYELCLVGKFIVEIPKLIEFRYADFWVVHDLPLNFALESLAGSIGNLMGKFLDYDTTSQCNYLNNYMSIRVYLNANDHLLQKKKLRKLRFSEGDQRISVGGLALKLVNIDAIEEGGGGTIGIRS